jgi:hypothetical protein
MKRDPKFEMAHTVAGRLDGLARKSRPIKLRCTRAIRNGQPLKEGLAKGFGQGLAPRLPTGSRSSCSRLRSDENFDLRHQWPRLARPPGSVDGAVRRIKRTDNGGRGLYLVGLLDVLVEK